MASFDVCDNVLAQVKNYFILGDNHGLCAATLGNDKNCEFNNQNKKQYQNSVEMAKRVNNIFKSNKPSTDDNKRKSCQPKVTVVKWKTSDQNNSTTIAEPFNFQYSNITDKKKNKSKISLLSLKIAKQDQSNSKFAVYTKICCETNFCSSSKKLIIYYKISTKQKEIGTLNILANVNAKIEELIGLILFKIDKLGSEPLKVNIKDFDLYMVEDNEPMFDFPCFDRKDSLSKFGFDEYFLTNRNIFDGISSRSESSKDSKSEKIVVIVHSSNGVSRLQVDSYDCTMDTILKLFLRKRGIKKPESEFHLEKKDIRGCKINLSSKLSSMGTLQFNIVRQNLDETIKSLSSTESVDIDYKFYNAILVVKFLTNYSVMVGVSYDGIDIEPVFGKNMLFHRIKPIHIGLSDVVSCLEDNKSDNEVTVKVTIMKNNKNKNFTLIMDQNSADDIIKRVNIFSKYVASNDRFSKLLFNEDKR